MKVFHIALVALSFLQLGGWTDWTLAADDQAAGQAVESSGRTVPS